MNIADMNLIFCDVEAVGDTPISGTMTQFGAVHYNTRQTFHGVLYKSHPDPDNPAKSIIDPNPLDRETYRLATMIAFSNWCQSFPGRPIFVSDNNGYDAMWISCAFDFYGLRNPFGHSSRRISDFYAGLRGDFAKTQEWKRWRVTPHTHHPVMDAMGNCEAFSTMMEAFGKPPSFGTEECPHGWHYGGRYCEICGDDKNST